MKNNIIFVFLCILVVSCIDETEEIYVPTNPPSGFYDYTTESQYFSKLGVLENIRSSAGTLDLEISLDSTYGSIKVTPFYGWSFTLQITTLSKVDVGGETVHVFRIPSQNIYIYDFEYSVRGTRGIPLIGVGGDVEGIYDGIISPSFNDFKLEYESTDIINLSQTKTLLSARELY